jgi:hypothetical protein
VLFFFFETGADCFEDIHVCCIVAIMKASTSHICVDMSLIIILRNTYVLDLTNPDIKLLVNYYFCQILKVDQLINKIPLSSLNFSHKIDWVRFQGRCKSNTFELIINVIVCENYQHVIT